jgi:hypothetical protein
MSKRLLHFLNFKWTKEIRSLRNQNQIIATQQSLKLFLLQVSNRTFSFLFFVFHVHRFNAYYDGLSPTRGSTKVPPPSFSSQLHLCT